MAVLIVFYTFYEMIRRSSYILKGALERTKVVLFLKQCNCLLSVHSRCGLLLLLLFYVCC